MAVDRTLAGDLVQTLVGMYARLEQQLAADIARSLRTGIDAPDWATARLAALGTLRTRTQRLLTRLDGRLGDEVARALILAYARGGEAALHEVGRQQLSTLERFALRSTNPVIRRLAGFADNKAAGIAAELASAVLDLPSLGALQRMAFALVGTLRGTHAPILRWTLDTYRAVIAETSLPPVIAGTQTRRRAAQIAWERFLTKGVTGFTDRSGRRWELASYVEMATRTGAAQAAVEGHMDRLADIGVDLVIVSNAPQECKLCRPWEGKILTRRGPTGRIQVQHATQDRMITVDVAGTIAEAIAAGLMHPSCRHSFGAYLAGVTTIPKATADPEGDADRQRLRELERRVRRTKLKAEAAISDDAKHRLNARVRDYQRQIREHTKATGLIRQRPREQVGVAR